ncbi:MAG: DUF308 domain-containing protein [Lachnospiraceae bacterium]|nr:DUF308 domain-containing protein [Lachnospiraceae bacterium]
MDKTQKNLRTGAYIASVCYIVVGLVAIIMPEDMLKLLIYIVGGACIVGGAVFVINYLIRDVKINYFRNDFLHGLVAILLGIIVILKWETVISMVPLCLGILVMISGCIKLQNAIDLKRMDSKSWVRLLVVAVINLILGAILVANPFTTAVVLLRALGVGLIFSGVTDLLSTRFFSREWKKSEEVVAAAAEVKPEEASAGEESSESIDKEL